MDWSVGCCIFNAKMSRRDLGREKSFDWSDVLNLQWLLQRRYRGGGGQSGFLLCPTSPSRLSKRRREKETRDNREKCKIVFKFCKNGGGWFPPPLPNAWNHPNPPTICLNTPLHSWGLFKRQKWEMYDFKNFTKFNFLFFSRRIREL